MMKNNLNPEWLNAIFKCAETLYIVDESTRVLLWTNNDRYESAVKEGIPCYKAFFDRDRPCSVCDRLKPGELCQWDYFDSRHGRWLKVKNCMFNDGDRVLRAGNFMLMDDAMELSHESVTQISELQKLLAENKRIKDALEYDSTHDEMTRIFNRNKFNEDIACGKYNAAGTGVLYFDLNNLKEVNDKYRHETGDMLIICLARAISKTAEHFSNAAAYRIGGDEFILVFSSCTQELLSEAHEYFNAILAENQSQPPCIVAIGEAFSDEICDGEKLVSKADQAMYRNKLFLKGITV